MHPKHELDKVQERLNCEASVFVGRLLAGGEVQLDAASDIAAAFVTKVVLDTIGIPEAGRLVGCPGDAASWTGLHG